MGDLSGTAGKVQEIYWPRIIGVFPQFKISFGVACGKLDGL